MASIIFCNHADNCNSPTGFQCCDAGISDSCLTDEECYLETSTCGVIRIDEEEEDAQSLFMALTAFLVAGLYF